MPQKPQQEDPDFIPAEQSPDFIPEQQPQTQAAPVEKPGFFARASESLGLTQHPIDQLSSEIGQFVDHPVSSIYNTVKAPIVGLRDTVNNLSPVKFDEGGAHINNPLTAARDMVGGKRFAEDVQNKNYRGAAGTLVGSALPIVVGKIPEAALPAARKIVGRIANPTATAEEVANASAETKPRVAVPQEVQARRLTKTVNPAVNEWENYIDATANEAGNIRDYALRNKMPLKTQLDWAKAAKGAAEEANEHFKQNVLKPFERDEVSVAGSGYKGSAGEGQRATLGEINNRITQINDELRSAYNKKEVGQTREALANEASLKAERDSLAKTLTSELGKRSGMTAEEVQQMRQRFGRSYSIADQTNSAVNQRQSSEGKIIEGRRDVPQTVPGVIAEGFNRYIRGGPEKIADKRFSKALGESSFPAEELPIVTPPQKKVPIRARTQTQ